MPVKPQALSYIDGRLCESGTSHDVISPATGHVVGTVAWAGEAEAAAALEAARRSAAAWRALGLDGRARHMAELCSAIAQAEVELRTTVQNETGKTWEQTEEDYRLLVDSLDFYAQAVRSVGPEVLHDRAGTHRHELRREPVGVVVAFIAWNFPLLNLGYKLGPAMAAGCPIVIKPSSRTPLAAAVVGRLCHEVGLPAGVVNILSGDDATVGDALSRSDIPALVTLIGSTDTARHVMAVGSTTVKRYSLELGGNAPVLVYPDADLDLAADTIALLKFANAGQVCVAPNRVLVHESVAAALTERLCRRAERIRVGTGPAGSADMGPLIDAGAVERVLGLVKSALNQGARLVIGGSRPDGAATDCYLAPTVVDGVTPQMDLFRQEVFGPVVSITTFTRHDDPVGLANDTDAGLTAYVFARDESVIGAAVDRLEFGEVHVNGVKYAIELPHGGFKQSGVGHDCSVLALEDYLVHKRVTRPLAMPPGGNR
ncbi:aldehyde dehydrogenase family protein [Streptomyces sp. NPDC006976]|uniref:aldehyde dehydrogenase family protein n=1 Tax=Streptomyces sp. NPDC006976 TaxID=3154311 RepID=UPI0033EB5BB6